MDQYYAAIILWSTALPLPLYDIEINTESASITNSNTNTESKVDESQSKEQEQEEQLQSQSKKQDESAVELKETAKVIVLVGGNEVEKEVDEKKDGILPDYSESEDDGDNDDDDDDTSKAQIASSSKDVDASVTNDDYDGADVPVENTQPNSSKAGADIANEGKDMSNNDDAEKDANPSTKKSAQEVGTDADATTTTTKATVATPAEQEHVNPKAHDDKPNDDVDMTVNKTDSNSKEVEVNMPSLFEAEMEEDMEESTPVDVDTTTAMTTISPVDADAKTRTVAKETETVDSNVDADSQMVLVDTECSSQMKNGLNSQDVASKSKEGIGADTQMVLAEKCEATNETETSAEIQNVSTSQVDIVEDVEKTSLQGTKDAEDELATSTTTMKASVPRQAQSVGVSVLESPILEDPAPQDSSISTSSQQPYRCSLRSLPPPEDDKDMNVEIREILAMVTAVSPKATKEMNVSEKEHDANALPRQKDSLVRKQSEEESCEFHDCKEIQSEEVEHEHGPQNTNMEISKDHEQVLMTQGQGSIEAAVNASPTRSWVESEGFDREDNDSSCFMTQDMNFDYE